MNRPDVTALAKAVVSPFHSFLLYIDYGTGPSGLFEFYLGNWKPIPYMHPNICGFTGVIITYRAADGHTAQWNEG